MIVIIAITISTPAIKIKNKIPSTHFEIVPKDKIYKIIGANNNALTKWNFKIKNKVKGSSKNQVLKNGTNRLNFKVKSVDVETSLLIDVYLPAKTSEKLKSHEQGHVSICKNIYAKSSKELPNLLEALLKKLLPLKDQQLKRLRKKH